MKGHSHRYEKEKAISAELLESELEWQGKFGNSSRSDDDISINKIKGGYSITIRNGFQTKLGTQIMLAIKDDSIFFKNDPRGYTVCFTKKSPDGNGYIKIGNNRNIKLDDFIGDYMVHYFQPLNLYYISKPDKDIM